MSNQSAAKEDWQWLSRQRVPMLNFIGTNYVRRWSILSFSLYVWFKNCVKSMHFVKFSIISHVCRFMQNKQKILKLTDMRVLNFFYMKFWNFWHITRLFPINRRKFINSQKQSVFGPPCTTRYIVSRAGGQIFKIHMFDPLINVWLMFMIDLS